MKMAPSTLYNRSKGLDSQQIEQVLDEIFADEDSGDTDIRMNEQSDNDDDDVAKGVILLLQFNKILQVALQLIKIFPKLSMMNRAILIYPEMNQNSSRQSGLTNIQANPIDCFQ
ncbi:hypothetical protein C0J52_06200 [Blattella germanica]|nr:hypothetical protein C0J52_06200 [Blattella germanica]